MFSTTVSRFALGAAALLFAPLSAHAASFTVESGATSTAAQTVSGVDAGLIQVGAILDVTRTAVTWNAPATGAGVSIVNQGTFRSGNRGIDTSGAVSGTFTLDNQGQIATADDSFRINTAFANGDLRVINSGTITSANGQVFDFNAATAASARVSIANSGTLTSSGSDAVRLGGGTIAIVNSGTISTTADGRRALSFDADANVETLQSFNLVNEATGRIIGTDDAFKISADANASAATITVDNRGLISSVAGQAIDFADLTSAGNVIRIVNSGTIQSATADALRPGAGATVVNSGLIQSTDLTATGDAVDFQGAGGAVENLAGGRIIGAKHGITGDGAVSVTNAAGATIAGSNGSGVNIDSTGDTLTTVVNRGVIRGQVTGAIDDDGAPDGVPDGDGDGVDVDGKLDLSNYGLIQGTGATGTNDGVPNTADGIAAGGGVIRNYAGGVIEAFDNFGGGTGRGILIDDSAQGAAPFATEVMNQGIIRADGVAITFIGDNADTIDNEGLINSGAEVAIDMGGGADTFISSVGSQVVGAVNGGAGVDTLALKGTGGLFDLDALGDAGAYRSFETLSVLANSSYAASGSSDAVSALDVYGALQLNGALASADATVFGGGVLTGDSSLGSLAVASGGVVSPGVASIGTITVANTLTFDQGSIYLVDVSAAAADRIVAGDVVIGGGAVGVAPTGGPVAAGTRYDIVSAGQVTGAFTGVASPFLFIDPTLSYSATAVTLELTRNGVSFTSVATSANQRAVAAALDAGGAAASYVAGVTSEADARRSLDLLSGEGHAALGSTLFSQNTLVADTLLSRLRQVSAGVPSLGAGGPVLSYAADGTSKSSAFDAIKAAPAAPVFATWAEGFGQWSKADGRRGAGSVDGSLGGFLAGADVTTDRLTFGLAGGYVSANSDVASRLSHTDADTVLIAAYVGATFDALKLRGGASYGWSDIDSRRTAFAGGLTERPRASYDGSTANVFAEAAYTLEWATTKVEPFAQLAWSNVDTDRFRERNADVTGLAGDGLSFDTVYTTLGARFATVFEMSGARVTPHATLAWRHAADDVTPEVGMRFRNGGGDFTVAGAPIARDSLLVGAGLDVGVGANVTLGVGYEGQLADNASTNAVKGRFSYRF